MSAILHPPEGGFGERRPRKSWGQHFLMDDNIQRKIIKAAEVIPGEQIVEIGPGRGILTEGLLAKGASVIAIEIDPVYVAALSQRLLSRYPNALQLVHANALRYRYDALLGAYKIVANLPYYLSTPLLFGLMAHRQAIPLMVLMLQREFADRLCASVGQSSYGALSVIVQRHADIHTLFPVSRTCFRPQPRVDSSVVRIVPLSIPRVSVTDESCFLRTVKAAFGYRRKSLANALVNGGFPKQQVLSALSHLQIDLLLRGETLSLSEFAQLSDVLHSVGVSLGT